MAVGRYNVPVPPLVCGDMVHGRYRVLRAVGSGGMGAVYEAIDLRLKNSVALKAMTARSAEADRAFAQEAQLLAALRHPSLPVVTDYFLDQDCRFLVMQYIDGEDLEHLRRRLGGSCDERDVLAWGVEILNILCFLHHHDPPIIHRDIKPSNLKLTPQGEIVLLDFGLAKGGGESTTRTGTEQHSVHGFTPYYAPPEQRDGRTTDARSDLYALGATLYHLVTGTVPAGADARMAVIASGHVDPLVASHQVSSVSEALSKILARAMQLRSEKRFQSATEMRDALARLRTIQQESPRGMEGSTARRIDAAMPSQAQVGRQIDLIVQVRFAASPRLGREDWPSKRVPEKIEQASESFELEYPSDPRTHQQLPARLRVRIVAPDFLLDGASEYLIEVTPKKYSRRLVFLLTPKQIGLCRVQVEVYAEDTLHLGTVPIEADAVNVPVTNPVLRVAHLVMGLFSYGDVWQSPVLFGHADDEDDEADEDAEADADTQLGDMSQELGQSDWAGRTQLQEGGPQRVGRTRVEQIQRPRRRTRVEQIERQSSPSVRTMLTRGSAALC